MAQLHRRLIYPVAVRLRGEQSVFQGLRDLRRLEWQTTEEIRQRQRQRLHALLGHAARGSSWYRAHRPAFDASGDRVDPEALLSRFPLLTKVDLQVNADRLRSELFRGRASRKTTGGSTGQPVTVLKDREATGKEMAATWLSYGWFGVAIGDRTVRFWGSPHMWKRRFRYRAADFVMNRRTFSAFAFTEDDLMRYWLHLVRFQPQYIHGYLSMLDAFARFLRAERLDVGKLRQLKVVVATAEALTEPQRILLTEVFGVPVLNEYGCGEVGPIAYGCPAGSLHVMTENIFMEILDDAGNPQPAGSPGHIVITDLNNHAMPLVRYQVGDFGVIGKACSCGRGFPVLDRVWGRSYDFVESADGRRFHGEFFMYAFEDLRSRGVPVEQFKIIQESADRLRVLLRFDEGANPTAIPHVRRALADRLPGMTFEVETVAEIRRAPSGKMRVIENRWRETTGSSVADDATSSS